MPKFGEIWVEFWYCYWYHPAVRFNFCFPFCYKNTILLKMNVLVIFICGWRRWWLLQLENFGTEDRRCCSWGHSWFCEWQIKFFYMLNGLPVNSSTSNLASICYVWISRLFWDTSRPIRCMKKRLLHSLQYRSWRVVRSPSGGPLIEDNDKNIIESSVGLSSLTFGEGSAKKSSSLSVGLQILQVGSPGCWSLWEW